MKPIIIEEDLLRKLYIDENLSLREISAKLKRPVSTIIKYMSRYNIQRRDKSSAQKISLNVRGHPMLGKHHTDDTKKLISSSLDDFWSNLSDDEYRRYRDLIGSAWRRKWNRMPKVQRENILATLKSASHEKAGEGSRFERFVAIELRNNGYTVEERSNNYMPSAQFEVDIMLPDKGICIEIDGPAHFTDIYGKDTLIKQQARDSYKDNYLTSAGFAVIRIRDNNGPLSKARIRRIINLIEEVSENGREKVHIMEQ